MDFSHRGNSMPTVSYIDIHGKAQTLAIFRGKPVLVNLWATWCGPCVIEMPTLDALAARTVGKMQVVTVSQDQKLPSPVPSWWATRGFSHLSQLIDVRQDLLAAYNDGHAENGSLPTTVLYDKDGNELWRMTGAMNWSSAHANALIAEVIE